MSKIVFHIEKYSSGSKIMGLDIHEQRKSDVHSNKDIDVSKKDLNVDLLNNGEKISFKDKINEVIETCRTPKTNIRKNSVKMVEAIVSSDKEFFEKLPREKQIEYFKKNLEYLQNRIGADRFVSAIIHFDETTPHAHINLVPIMKDGRLSARDLFDRKSLIQIQTELAKDLKDAGFNIERGIEGSKVKHMDTIDYKRKMTEVLRPLDDLDKLFRQSKINKNQLIMAKENLDVIKSFIEGSVDAINLSRDKLALEHNKAKIERENEKLKALNENYAKAGAKYMTQYDKEKELNQENQKEIKDLKEQIEIIEKAFSNLSKENKFEFKSELNTQINLKGARNGLIRLSDNVFKMSKDEIRSVQKATQNTTQINTKMGNKNSFSLVD